MNYHQILPLVNGCCLLLAGVFVVVPLVTNNWVVLSININVGPLNEAVSKVKNITEFFAAVTKLGGIFMPTIFSQRAPMINLMSPKVVHILENVSINVDISFGLKKVCLDVNVHGLQDQLQTLFNNKNPTFPCTTYTWFTNKLLQVKNMHDKEEEQFKGNKI